jgi:hypothetical protein
VIDSEALNREVAVSNTSNKKDNSGTRAVGTRAVDMRHRQNSCL